MLNARSLLTGLFLLGLTSLFGQRDFYQHYPFTQADTLRGMLRPERSCYDVTFYELDLQVNIAKRELSGFVDIHYQAVTDFTRLQIDLYANMKIQRIEWNGRDLTYTRQHNAVFIDFPRQRQGSQSVFRVYYQGKPTVAKKPPWDGGFIWSTDPNGNPWVGVACEGDGASLWWPNKDHLSDEPDSLVLRIAVPEGLSCVANGQLVNTRKLGNGYQRFDWKVSYPINNYNVTLNIADYAHFSDTYVAADGEQLELDYYVLRDNLEKAKQHFGQVQETLACFENYLGKYPFWRDGYALVETPYLGMEHQGAIAYGNNYQRGYRGGMIPRYMNWDYIIVHETGHEYFGNSISCNDLSEMWIHESFTTYLEALFVECSMSYEDYLFYLGSQRPFLGNREPILGPRDVNWEDWKVSDHYFKGSWVLHTLRHAIHDDTRWFEIFRGFYEKYQHSNIDTEAFIDYVEAETGKDWSAFFEQYLWYPDLPTLVYKLEKKGKDLLVSYRWEADVADFTMPVLLGDPKNYQLVFPLTDQVGKVRISNLELEDFDIATDRFLIRKRRL